MILELDSNCCAVSLKTPNTNKELQRNENL